MDKMGLLSRLDFEDFLFKDAHADSEGKMHQKGESMQKMLGIYIKKVPYDFRIYIDDPDHFDKNEYNHAGLQWTKHTESIFEQLQMGFCLERGQPRLLILDKSELENIKKQCQDTKTRGNNSFKKGQLDEALDEFSKGLEIVDQYSYEQMSDIQNDLLNNKIITLIK